jgi:hypothetical protein
MIFRVVEQGKPVFQLRKGEEGISVFDPGVVAPPLTEIEILGTFRPGSAVVSRSQAEIEAKGLLLIPLPGAGFFPPRLRSAHAEIRPGPGMTRSQFKIALKELE